MAENVGLNLGVIHMLNGIGQSAQEFPALFPQDRYVKLRPAMAVGPSFSWKSVTILLESISLQNCIEHCQKKFHSTKNARFHVNNGLDLKLIDDQSIDLVFSMDSLVHCDFDTIKSYVSEILRVLSPDGKAFIHHSNLGASPEAHKYEGKRTPFWRTADVSSEIVQGLIKENSGHVISQETVNWNHHDSQIDCFTAFGRGDQGTIVPIIIENSEFSHSTDIIRNIQPAYTPKDQE